MIRRPPRRLLVAALLAAALRPADASGQRAERSDYRSWIDTTFAFSRSGRVDLAQVSGDVVVTAWDRPEIRVRAYAQHGRIEPTFSSSRVALRLDADTPRAGRSRIGDSRYEVTVPIGVRVEAGTTSGDVSITGTRGEVEVSTTSGDIVITDAAGPTSVTSVAGDLQLTRLDGDLTANLVNGDADLRDVRGDVRASTVSGDIALRGVTGRMVMARTTNGDLLFEGDLARGGRYEFVSHSGDVELALPAGVGADLSVQTFSGSLQTAFPVTLGGGARHAARPRTLEFRLGDGGARVRAETFSGDVLLQRAERSR